MFKDIFLETQKYGFDYVNKVKGLLNNVKAVKYVMIWFCKKTKVLHGDTSTTSNFSGLLYRRCLLYY